MIDEHLLQVGRTGRAGKDGAVTSLVSVESRDLADAIRCSADQRSQSLYMYSRPSMRSRHAGCTVLLCLVPGS